MSIKPPGNSGFTWTEVLVAIAITGILIVVVYSKLMTALAFGPMSATLSNMKQLTLATQMMALDGEKTKDTNLGWPGDTGGTFSSWTRQLVNDNYLSTNDLSRLFSGPGKGTPLGKIPTMQDSALLVYAVSKKSDDSTVFLTTANFTNTPTGGQPPKRSAKPYGNICFAVFRKAGDGAVLRPKQTGDTNLIGTYAPLCR